MRGRTSGRGFTLVELLVVIGIISLLISILLPSLARARESAVSVACLSNLRQMGIAINMYTNENQGKLPVGDYGKWFDTTPDTLDDDTRWYLLINPYLGGVGNTEKTIQSGNGGSLSKLFQCPGAFIASGRNHYSANIIVMPNKKLMTLAAPLIPYKVGRMGAMRNPAEVVLIAEGTQVQGHWNWSAEPVAKAMDGYIEAWSTGGVSETTRQKVVGTGSNRDEANWSYPPGGDIRWRHMGNSTMNVLYADGHAESHKPGSLLRGNFVPQGWSPGK